MTAVAILNLYALLAQPLFLERAFPRPDRDPETVEELYRAYRYFELPLPPKGTRLKSTHLQNEQFNATHLFLHEPSRERFSIYTTIARNVEATWRTIESHGREIPSGAFRTRFRNEKNWLIFAVEASHLGWSEIADKSWSIGYHASEFQDSVSCHPILEFLKELAWSYHQDRISDRSIPWSISIARLQRCRSEDPENSELEERYFEILNRTCRRDWNTRSRCESIINDIRQGQKITRPRIEDVAVYYAHREDYRFIGESYPWMLNNFRGIAHRQMTEICSDALDELQNYEPLREKDRNRSENDTIFDDPVQQEERLAEWYHRVKGLSTESYLKVRLRENRQIETDTYLAEEIVNNFPNLWPEYSHKLTKSNLIKGYTKIFTTIASSRLPESTKRMFFQDILTRHFSGKELNLAVSIWHFDPAWGRSLFETHWKPVNSVDDDASLVQLGSVIMMLSQLKDERLWETFRNWLVTKPVRFRQYWKNSLDNVPYEQRLRMNMVYLDDTRKDPDSSSPSNRESALESLAYELKIHLDWEPHRSEEDWAELKAKVKAAAERAIREKAERP